MQLLAVVVAGGLVDLAADLFHTALITVSLAMSLTYLDQNALIELGKRARQSEFRKKLDALLQSGALQIVVSSWHLIETAHTTNIKNAVELAEFIDSLNPLWLLERRDIQRLDVEEDLYRFLKIDHENYPRVTTRSIMWATVNREKDAAKFDIPSRRFVEQWINHPEQLEPIEKPYKDNAGALIGLRKAVKEGKLKDDIRDRVDRKLVKKTLPKFTRGGLELGRDLKAEYVKQAKIQDIPTFAIEKSISEHEWNVKDGSGTDRNTLIDKFYLISALPYVDEIVSNDHFFHTIYPFTVTTRHVRAKLIRTEEFFKRFQ